MILLLLDRCTYIVTLEYSTAQKENCTVVP